MIKELREKLLQAQKLLHESTKDFLELKFAARQSERRWMHEKDRLLQELDKSAKHESVKEDEVGGNQGFWYRLSSTYISVLTPCRYQKLTLLRQ